MFDSVWVQMQDQHMSTGVQERAVVMIRGGL
jgi:hypothetical protein